MQFLCPRRLPATWAQRAARFDRCTQAVSSISLPLTFQLQVQPGRFRCLVVVIIAQSLEDSSAGVLLALQLKFS
jgi:hypothetical protein